jgi:hypothetical protein
MSHLQARYPARVAMVTGNISLDDLTSHCGQPSCGKALEGLVGLCPLHFADCQVHNRAQMCNPVTDWPVFGRDVLHRIDYDAGRVSDRPTRTAPLAAAST